MFKKIFVLLILFISINIFSNEIYYNTGELMYSGEIKYGIPNGEGKIYNKKGQLVYEGEFKNGYPEGRGKIYINGILRYEGEIKKG
ncbi:MORN repeat protein, partial [Hypnocyclicus thermotrophus]